MADHEINIELRADGGSKVVGEFGRIDRASSDLIVNVKKIGNVFGELGGNIAGLVQNILKGGVFGIVQGVIQLGVSAFLKWRDAAKVAEREIAEAEKETHEKRMKHLSEFATAAEKASAARNDAISKETSALKEEINATKELTKATLELQRASAFKKGDKDEVESIDRKLKGLDAEASAQIILAEMDAAARMDESARKDYKKALIGRGSARDEAAYIEAQLKDAISAAREEAGKKAAVVAAGVIAQLSISEEAKRAEIEKERKSGADEGEAKLRKTDKYKELESRLKSARDAEKEFQDLMDAATRSIDAAKAAQKSLGIRADALLANEDTKKINEELEAKDAIKTLEKYALYKASGSYLTFDQWQKNDKEGKAKALLKQKEQYLEFLRTNNLGIDVPTDAEEISENDEAFKKFIKDRKEEEAKAEQDAAKERERLDRELHQKRMADIKAEADEMSKRLAEASRDAQMMSAVKSAAQTEFERAFAMYRDPEKAKEQIAEERDYSADLKQLHKDARRYGGKWRIDELSQLMSAGDTQGVTDTLERWRKNKNFTPQVEAMVRASAAEQTKTTAEDELRKLNDRTERLVADLKDLSDTRDAKLEGIERNTNQLANKLDELLSVKG